MQDTRGPEGISHKDMVSSAKGGEKLCGGLENYTEGDEWVSRSGVRNTFKRQKAIEQRGKQGLGMEIRGGTFILAKPSLAPDLQRHRTWMLGQHTTHSSTFEDRSMNHTCKTDVQSKRPRVVTVSEKCDCHRDREAVLIHPTLFPQRQKDSLVSRE